MDASRIKRRLQKMREFTSTPGQGVTRLPFSAHARHGASYLLNQMKEAGLQAWIDLVGNVRGILPADKPGAQTIIAASHYDTVKHGGEFDGIAGVICAIELAQLLQESGIPRKYNLEVIAFNDEEGMMFGSGCLGSKSLTGQIDQEYITHLTDENGISIREWINRWGNDPDKIGEQKIDLDRVRAYFEVHIEQGPVLDSEKLDLGVVNCIVGLLRCSVSIHGRADHAGTTPMDMRRDSINIAAKVISKLDEYAADEQNGSVATCGFIRALPNAMNVVAGECEFTIDLRSQDDNSIEIMKYKITQLLNSLTRKCGASWDMDIKLRQHPVYMNDELVRSLENNCRKEHFSYKTMLSGAAHDAMVFADKVDTAMIFVPSKDGRSHCPEEHSEYEDFGKAVQVLYDTVSSLMQETNQDEISEVSGS